MNTPEHYDPEELIPIPTQRRFGPWSKLGGGALTFAILIHVIVLTIAGIWIYTVLPPAQPPGNFVRNPGKPHGQTDAQPTAASIIPTQSIPSADLRRLVAMDAQTPQPTPAKIPGPMNTPSPPTRSPRRSPSATIRTPMAHGKSPVAANPSGPPARNT
jgi:hypothetical protein